MSNFDLSLDKINIPDEFDFHISQCSIDNGVRRNARSCPITISFKESEAMKVFSLVDMDYIETDIFLKFNGRASIKGVSYDTYFMAELSDAMLDWMFEFDNYNAVSPINVKLKVNRANIFPDQNEVLVVGHLSVALP